MATAGVSTLGIKLGYGTGASKPASFKQFTRINSVGEINLETEQIDASALEDYVSKYVEGRQDTGGSVDVVVNATDETIAEWEAAITAYQALSGTEEMWFVVWSPYLSKSFFFKAGLPAKLNMPGMDQNALQTMTISLTIHEYVGLDTAVEPTA